MPRARRVSLGGLAYHVLNRGTGRMRIFDTPEDYEAFERVMAEARQRIAMRVCAYALMPNHWHLVLWPRQDGDLSRFVGWLTMTHVQRWHARRQSAGAGYVYQGRFKSFPIQADEHFLTVARYVERNPLRAALVPSAEDWRWSSLWMRRNGKHRSSELLDPWPLQPPRNWLRTVNLTQTPEQEQALRTAIQRGRPFGNDTWVKRTAARLGLQSTLRPRGRPRTEKAKPQKGS